jgi:hypothetical protein
MKGEMPMTISNLQLVSLGLMPGKAEELEIFAQSHGKLKAMSVAKGIKSSRNETYIGAALVLIGSLGEVFGAHTLLVNASIVSIGGLILVGGGTKLYEILSRISCNIARIKHNHTT